jgi:hypothetical protein
LWYQNLMDNYIIHVSILLAFSLGYILGRLDIISSRLAGPAGPTYQSPLAKSSRGGRPTPVLQPDISTIDINETKVVTKIDTSGMQRMGEKEMGKTTSTADNISSSVSKLAQLKGK